MKSPRVLAAEVIDKVTDGHSLSECLDPALQNLADPRDRALVQAMAYGVCRYYSRLDAILYHLLNKPLNAKDSDIHALILIGLYQIIEMRIPAHAAVSETVNAVDELNKTWAKGLVNAVLRNYLRQEETLKEKLVDDLEAEFAHPSWWIDKMEQAWPHHYQEILTANNMHPPFVLRINLQNISRENYLQQLADKDIAAEIFPLTDSGIILDTAVPVLSLPGFAEGDISVQDGAAQLAASLLSLKPNTRVLDACAAPGGKLMHILEIQPNLSALVAIEKDRARMLTIKENLKRGGMTGDVTCITQDVTNVHKWWDQELFDTILLDAPCSASGVIRRHPDIKLLRQSEDIDALADTQLAILNAIWPTLKSSGELLYVTCSVFHEENEDIIQAFLARNKDVSEIIIDADWGHKRLHGRQILPGENNMDGFYYAKLKKS